MGQKQTVVDDLDRKIISEVQKDGRTSYTDIAKRLKVSDGTIHFRVGRLMRREGMILWLRYSWILRRS